MVTITLAVVRRRSWLALAALLIALAGLAVAARPAPAALPASSVVGTVIISGISGGTSGMTQAIPIKSYSWSVTKSPGGKPVLSKLTFTKALDAASPLLFRSVVLGQQLASVSVNIYDPGTTTVRANFAIGDVVVSAVSDGQAANTVSAQTETVSLSFSRVRETWHRTSGGSVTYCYNTVTAAAC